ncbi:hypothetical protein PybrP1_004066 [[Pythium] brassicae (nom. inval.)]|nr:hypothetical protein PybrP1_004066 [[Pythium] brassicae (nom. inval.)]
MKLSPRTTLSAVFLSGVTGMTVAGVSLLAYIRFQHPEEFVDTAVKMSHPEAADAFTRKWGVFGSGIADAVPERVKQFFDVPDLPQRMEEHKRKREAQLRQTLEDLRPK